MISKKLLHFILILIGTIGSCKKNDYSTSLKMRWQDLSLKTICEEEEWKQQFVPIKEKFTKCLGLSKIAVDQSEENDVDKTSFLRGESHNPYCKISKTWEACTRYLEGLNCIEPNTEELSKVKKNGYSGLMGEDLDRNLDPENINSMAVIYKKQCEAARFFSNYGPFGSHAFGMNYYGDYDAPPDIDVDGLAQEEDL